MDEIREQLRQAQLSALQNAITPHYIVNALDALRMKLIMDGQDGSAELMRCLQSSLRTYGFQPGEPVTLEQELSFLEDFLRFHQFRFLGNLSWQFLVPPALMDRAMPRFLLQPLVENSLRHGLSADSKDPQLQIKAWQEGQLLCLSVTDNGKGFSEKSQSYGTGLANVDQRLQLLFGEACRLHVSSIPGSGTCVTLRLPEKGGEYL